VLHRPIETTGIIGMWPNHSLGHKASFREAYQALNPKAYEMHHILSMSASGLRADDAGQLIVEVLRTFLFQK